MTHRLRYLILNTALLGAGGVSGSASAQQTTANVDNRGRLGLAEACEGSAASLPDSLSGVVTGSVRFRRSFVPAPNVTVVAEWTIGTGDPSTRTAPRQPPRFVMTRTDSSGVFRLCYLPIDRPLTIRTNLELKGDNAREIRLVPGARSIRVDIDVDAARPAISDSGVPPVPLEVVSVIAARSVIAEFEERRLGHVGHFITREQLDPQQYRKMADVLSQLPGARVLRGYGSHAWVSGGRGQVSMRAAPLDRWDIQRGAKPACYCDVYVDGAIVYASGGPAQLFDINTISPGEIEGVEYYSGGAQIPAKFNKTGSACGVLVIWTRR